MPELVLFTDAGVTRRHALLDSLTTLGRMPQNDVVLTDRNVSRTHAMVVHDDAGFTIKDCDSCNGVYVNGRRVQSQALVDGDMLALGACRMRFVDGVQDASRLKETMPGTLVRR